MSKINTNETDAKIEQIRKILAKANGTDNKFEAITFARKAKAMMAENGLTEADLDANPIGEGEYAKRKATWHGWVASATAEFFGCVAIFSTRPYGTRAGTTQLRREWKLVGRKAAVITAELMADHFFHEIRRKSREWQIANEPDSPIYNTKGREDFEKATALALCEKLAAGTRKRDGAEVAAWLEANMPDVTDGKETKVTLTDAKAAADGMAAGAAINIDQQVATDAKGKPKLAEQRKLEAA
jgi:hypothetical protein